MVTGGGRGIGRAVALRLAREGMRVLVTARSEEELDEVVTTIRAEGGDGAAVCCDLSDTDAVGTLADRALEWGGKRLDVLINNAGVFLEAAVPHTSPDAWERLLRVNLTAPFVLCRRILPSMIEVGSGHIVNVGSSAGLKGYRHQAAYCASKHGLVGFGRALSMEAKPHNVHVTTLCPGGVRTGLIAGSAVS